MAPYPKRSRTVGPRLTLHTMIGKMQLNSESTCICRFRPSEFPRYVLMSSQKCNAGIPPNHHKAGTLSCWLWFACSNYTQVEPCIRNTFMATSLILGTT